MRLEDIQPYLRFVNTINFQPVNKYFCATDNHFYYMPDGECPMYIDGVRYLLRCGTVAIVPLGVPYYFDTPHSLRIVSINFDYTQAYAHEERIRPPSYMSEFDRSRLLVEEEIENCAFLNKPLVLENMTPLKPNIDAILEEYTYKKQFYREVCATHFRHILFEIARHVLWGRRSNESVNAVLGYIHKHYAEPITNATLASLTGYHPYHLNRLMRAYTGTTLHRYLINYRIEVAKRLLREGNTRICDIAERVGYGNTSNFSADFKRKVGLSPLQFRLPEAER